MGGIFKIRTRTLCITMIPLLYSVVPNHIVDFVLPFLPNPNVNPSILTLVFNFLPLIHDEKNKILYTEREEHWNAYV